MDGLTRLRKMYKVEIKKGERKTLPANTGRPRINLSGAIDVVTHNIVIQEDWTLNAESTIRFCKKIEEAYPGMRKIHVFCDNASYYRNKAVQQHLAISKVTLHFLPPYSPNLNPIERLWKWMKEQVIYNTYYEHFEDFKGAILGFFVVLSTVTEMDSKIGFELARKLLQFADHKCPHIVNIRAFMIGKLRCFGAAENPIFEFISV